VERLIKDKSLWIIIGLCFLYLVMLLSVPRGEVSSEEKVKQWKPRDFYLVYKMWTDEEYRNVNDHTSQ
jgi:hypothetical protein